MRGIDVLGDKFVIITFFGVYLDPVAVPLLSVKWKGKTTEELMESVPFFREVVTGASLHHLLTWHVGIKSKGFQLCLIMLTFFLIFMGLFCSLLGTFEKFIKVTMRVPLPGQLYSQTVTGTFVEIWKSLGIYTDSEAKAVEKFLEVFKDEKFPRGASILFALSPEGSLTVLDAFTTSYKYNCQRQMEHGMLYLRVNLLQG